VTRSHSKGWAVDDPAGEGRRAARGGATDFPVHAMPSSSSAPSSPAPGSAGAGSSAASTRRAPCVCPALTAAVAAAVAPLPLVLVLAQLPRIDRPSNAAASPPLPCRAGGGGAPVVAVGRPVVVSMAMASSASRARNCGLGDAGVLVVLRKARRACESMDEYVEEDPSASFSPLVGSARYTRSYDNDQTLINYLGGRRPHRRVGVEQRPAPRRPGGKCQLQQGW
jgi:hypothetical protein